MNSHDLIMQMRQLLAEYDRAAQVPARPDCEIKNVDPVRSIVTMVGLSVGEYDEVTDPGYKRQEVSFALAEDGLWRNVNAVHFPMATRSYTVDSAILEGVEFQKRVAFRMAAPVHLMARMTGVGFAPKALSITPEVMRLATGQTEDRPAVGNVWEELANRMSTDDAMRADNAMRAHMEAHRKLASDRLLELMRSEGKAREVMELEKAHALRVEAEKLRAEAVRLRDQKRALAVKAVNEAAVDFYRQMTGDNPAAREGGPLGGVEQGFVQTPPGEIYTLKDAQDAEATQGGPGYCDACERISLPRRNQLVSMGHSVSHLVELPNEAGYALPCKACRKP